jgi:hypothetical protein
MSKLPRLMRPAALAIAATTWTGLAVQLVASVRLTGSVLEALWIMLLYFTVITNIVVALLFSALASGWHASPRLIGGVTLAITLVGIVYHTLLRGLLDLSGGVALADFLLHTVTPIIVLAWWIAFASKGGLDRRDPLGWVIFPLVYFGYGLARGAMDDRYPYPFMNLAALGWPHTLLNAAAIASGFIVAGYTLFTLDRLLSRS